jgi:hypothetical protein
MIEKVIPVTLHAIADAQLNGNGSAADASNAHDIVIVAEFSKGDAAAKTFTLQRDDDAGTGFIAIANNAKIWVAADLATSDTLVRQADAVLFNTGAVATAHRLVMKVNPDSLGLHTGAGTNPCTQLRCVVAGGHADDRGSVTAYLMPRYKPS